VRGKREKPMQAARLFLSTVLCVVLLAGKALADVGYTDLAALDADIATFVGAAHIAGRADPVDRRLKLVRCGASPSIQLTSSGRALEVACSQPVRWRVFVHLAGADAASPGPGQILAPVVRRQDNVVVAVRGPGFLVTNAGVAEEDGRTGARIRVRAGSTGARSRGSVGRDGNVLIGN
jgi:hypothetical protein